MPRCSDCGFNNRETAKRCAGCGAPLMSAGVGRSDPTPVRAAAPPPPTVPEAVNVPSPVAPTRHESVQPLPATRLEGHAGAGQYQGGAQGRTVLQEEAVRPLSGFLVVLRSASMPQYQEVPIFLGANTLGRNPALGVHCIQDENVSTQHAVVVGERGRAEITDLGSSNGTIVNEKKVRTTFLQKGDMVKLGRSRFVFIPVPVLQD